jgi:thiol:disulfide interchange protein DsbD
MLRCLLSLLLLLATLAQAEEFLDPLVAFKPGGARSTGRRSRCASAIAKGYYLYRDKFRFKPPIRNPSHSASAVPGRQGEARR